MNGELPPVDHGIHDQLARRSAGRLPESLLADISAAVDAASAVRPGRVGLGRVAAEAPRLAVAASLALVVVIAAAMVAVPRFMTSPAASTTYPVDRAMTTDELERLLAGPQLAVNNALVASVTIDPQPDACPMNSRPTYGVIHGIEPQVCVVGPIGDTGSVATGQNVFAFRYMGPGVLGLLGLIQPASASRLTHAVADDWSQAGKVFLVEGWLGNDPLACPSNVPTNGGDPLNPDGPDQCGNDWMSDEDPNTTPSPDVRGVPSVPKRLVDAGGMQIIDDIGYPAVHGVYVVRFGATVGCSGSSGNVVGCGLVLAKIADLTIPTASPSPSPAPSPTPTAAPSVTPAPVATPVIPDGSAVGLIGAGNRPLTVAEFVSLWASDPANLAGRIVIVKGPVPEDLECSNQGVTPNGSACGTIAPEGYWAVSVGSAAKVSVLGALVTSSSGFVWTVDGAKAGSGPKAGQIIAVDALLEYWLNFCDIQRIGGCSQSWLVRPDDNMLSSIEVQESAYATFAPTPTGIPAKIRGVYLLRVGEGNSPWTLLARLEPATLP